MFKSLTHYPKETRQLSEELPYCSLQYLCLISVPTTNSSISSPAFAISFLFDNVHQLDGFLTVVLICPSLIANDTEPTPGYTTTSHGKNHTKGIPTLPCLLQKWSQWLGYGINALLLSLVTGEENGLFIGLFLNLQGS